MPSHFRLSRIASTEACVERSRSVSSTRRTNTPLLWRANAHEYSAVRAPPTWRNPVGLGAKRVRTWLVTVWSERSWRPGGKAGIVVAMSSVQPNSMPGYTLPVYPYRTPPELRGDATETYPVIVAGGGLGGLTCALELGSRGIRTVVLDEDDTVGAAALSSR